MVPNEPNDQLADDAAKDTARGGNLLTESEYMNSEGGLLDRKEEAEMNEKHTPKPWSVAGPSKPDNVGGRDYAVLDADGKIIAEAFEKVGHDDIRPAKFNAYLIAESPALLEAAEVVCGEAMDLDGTYGFSQSVSTQAIRKLKVAIARAKGAA